MHTWPVVMNVAPLILANAALVEHGVAQHERRVVAAQLEGHVGDVSRRAIVMIRLPPPTEAGEADVPGSAGRRRRPGRPQSSAPVTTLSTAGRQRPHHVLERLHRRQRAWWAGGFTITVLPDMSAAGRDGGRGSPAAS